MRQRLNHPRVEFKISEVPQRHHRVAPFSFRPGLREIFQAREFQMRTQLFVAHGRRLDTAQMILADAFKNFMGESGDLRRGFFPAKNVHQIGARDAAMFRIQVISQCANKPAQVGHPGERQSLGHCDQTETTPKKQAFREGNGFYRRDRALWLGLRATPLHRRQCDTGIRI